VLAVLAGTGLAVATAPRAMAQALKTDGKLLLALDGRPQQCGFVVGRTLPGAGILVDGQKVGVASRDGVFIVGFDRDAPASAVLTLADGPSSVTQTIAVAPGDYDIQRIDGLPQDQVTPSDPALLARIAAEAKRKAVGFASDIDADFFRDGFSWPVQFTRISARFGGQRILNGVPERPHYGIDLAAPIGTPIVAPGAGMVCFAETGLHYEGGLVMIDHGQGLVSMYLHMSKVEVTAGQMLAAGARIGEVGMEGRATGPHCCWRMKWRGRNMDPSLLVGAPFPPVST
jgi:murein DD-endopeptidase MepM/ murein hydrolase activator NlpD